MAPAFRIVMRHDPWYLLPFTALAVAVTGGAAQPSPARTLRLPTIITDTLLRTPGPEWSSGQSRHFVVHIERPVAANGVARMLDSLEAAWKNAVTRLGETVREDPRAHVFVIRSRVRFAGVVSPESKGLTTRLRDGIDVVVLVQNDSVRAYTRHEVMDLVSWRAWGAPGESRAWLSEGLATFADGHCQGVPTLAVARDLLAARPALRVSDVAAEFANMVRTERAAAYLLAGSLVDYLWTARGLGGVQRLGGTRSST